MDLKPWGLDLDPQYRKRTALVEIEGVPLITYMLDNWDSIWGFQARPDDLLICTYPKAGTTWIQEIVDMVQHRGDAEKCARAPIFQRMPFIEMCLPKPIPTGVEEADAMPSPRIIKSHLPVQLVPPSFWRQNCKMIYVARNAKDNAVSYFHFHHMAKLMPEIGNWEEYLEDFLTGKLSWGSWFDHVRGWWEAKDRHPILYLFYEDMKEVSSSFYYTGTQPSKDPAQEIQKVAQFLSVDLSEPTLNQIVQHTSFESMKENPMTNYTIMPSFIMDHTESPFMRKGTVGNWKKYFTVADSERWDDICTHKLAGSGLNFRTQL